MRQEDEREEHLHDAQKAKVEIEAVLELSDDGGEPKQLEQAEKPKEAQEAKHAQLILLAREERVD